MILADDHLEVLQETQFLLESEFDLAGLAQDGVMLVDLAGALRPDAVVTDLQMPGLNGIEAGRRILERDFCRAVVVLTMYNERHLVEQALECGIQGYVLKMDAGNELIPALRTVLAGGSYLSEGVKKPRRTGPR